MKCEYALLTSAQRQKSRFCNITLVDNQIPATVPESSFLSTTTLGKQSIRISHVDKSLSTTRIPLSIARIASKRWLSPDNADNPIRTTIKRLSARNDEKSIFHFPTSHDKNFGFADLMRRDEIAFTVDSNTFADANLTKQLIRVFVDFQETTKSLNFRVSFSEIVIAFRYKLPLFL